MYKIHIEVASLVYIYVYVGSKTIFFPVHLNIVVQRLTNSHTCLTYQGALGLIGPCLN